MDIRLNVIMSFFYIIMILNYSRISQVQIDEINPGRLSVSFSTYTDLSQNPRISFVDRRRAVNSVPHFSASQFRGDSAIRGKKVDSRIVISTNGVTRIFFPCALRAAIHGSRNISRHDFLRHYILYETLIWRYRLHLQIPIREGISYWAIIAKSRNRRCSARTLIFSRVLAKERMYQTNVELFRIVSYGSDYLPSL